MSDKLGKEAIVEAIGNLTVIELAELVKSLEDKFGIQAAVPMMAAGAGVAASGAAAAPAAEEKTEFTVVLTNVGANKIPVIKLVREITGLGLKEAKDLVEGAPKPVKENLPKDQAEEMKKKFVELAAVVELQ
jgi:large subunit ribosomal protein L7/L12